MAGTSIFGTVSMDSGRDKFRCVVRFAFAFSFLGLEVMIGLFVSFFVVEPAKIMINTYQINEKKEMLSECLLFLENSALPKELFPLPIKIYFEQGFTSCILKIVASSDKCGHPEIPINGTVNWKRGSTSATYSCHEGYSLEPSNDTRTCQKGKWSGREPICKLFSLNKLKSKFTMKFYSN
jgi:Sushi repeat (SCR repeat)